jgi:hypothetical protein
MTGRWTEALIPRHRETPCWRLGTPPSAVADGPRADLAVAFPDKLAVLSSSPGGLGIGGSPLGRSHDGARRLGGSAHVSRAGQAVEGEGGDGEMETRTGLDVASWHFAGLWRPGAARRGT